ncbi:hypothetical protein [Bacillus phage Anath]|uniref:SsDNA binding protein n=1 Tax=Bacillus phage Anath TaxID=2108114 RepID=A0A2P1JUL7_9CAUD|nr:hypothetical protein [Bacillus phage Anath]
MTNVNNGWDSVGVEENKGGGSTERKKREIDFLALPEGDTVIRVLDSAPHKYNEWWAVKGDGGGANGKGSRIPYHGENDLLEKANKEFMAKKFKEADSKGLKDKARKDFLRDYGYAKAPYGKLKTKYVIHVIDRADGTIKLLDGTGGIFEDIKKIAKRKGNPQEYDLVITREGLDFQNTEYTVIYDEKFPLTDKEVELYNEKKVDLKALKGADFCTPEQAKQVADGAKWQDVLEHIQSDIKESQEESNEGVPAGHTEDTPAQEEKPARKDEPVNIDQGEELSDADLENMNFE